MHPCRTRSSARRRSHTCRGHPSDHAVEPRDQRSPPPTHQPDRPSRIMRPPARNALWFPLSSQGRGPGEGVCSRTTTLGRYPFYPQTGASAGHHLPPPTITRPPAKTFIFWHARLLRPSGPCSRHGILLPSAPYILRSASPPFEGRSRGRGSRQPILLDAISPASDTNQGMTEASREAIVTRAHASSEYHSRYHSRYQNKQNKQNKQIDLCDHRRPLKDGCACG